ADAYQLILGLRSEIAEFTNEAMSLESQLVALRSMAKLGEIDGISFHIKPEQRTKHKSWHVHCRYAEYELSLGIDGNYLAGDMPNKQFAKAVLWVRDNKSLITKKIREFGEGY
ncbi:MAG: DUF4160 domain-containing protein, partial [Treponema sp.]|nr:DUF4160 domain-containing protein [Treponema sp.]